MPAVFKLGAHECTPTPCKECRERKPNCHATCINYTAFQLAEIGKKDNIKKSYKLNNDFGGLAAEKKRKKLEYRRSLKKFK